LTKNKIYSIIIMVSREYLKGAIWNQMVWLSKKQTYILVSWHN